MKPVQRPADTAFSFKGDTVLWKGSWTPLRSLLTTLTQEEYSALARARGMDNFERTHVRCGRCGAPTEAAPDPVTPYAKRCSEPGCEGYTAFSYPSFSIAILVTVTRRGGSELLLAHNTAWPEPRLSIIAGFLNPGESLEACVRREVLEETGLRIAGSTFSHSQPWPFPASLLAGFTAEWGSGELKVDGVELDRAVWINREQFSRAQEWTAKSQEGLQIPPRGSLSRQLMDEWAAK